MKKNKKIIIICAVIITISMSGFWFIKNRHHQQKPALGAETTSQQPSAQANFTDGGTEKQIQTTDNTTNRGSASVEDTTGLNHQATTTPTVSTNGDISIYQPAKNTKLTSGQVISGKSTLKVVSYRVIDSISGVIASGELKVTNGSFSGKLSFNTIATEGRLDFFATNPDGSEYSNIEIPVRF